MEDFAYDMYEKEDLEEVIEPGDVIEVTPTGKYRRTREKFSKCIIGVAVIPKEENEDLEEIRDMVYDIYDGSEAPEIENTDDIKDNTSEDISSEEPVISSKICVATYGRVAVNITGLACVGDILVSSQVPGYAMAYDRTKAISGTILGKVVELTEDVHVVIMQIMLS